MGFSMSRSGRPITSIVAKIGCTSETLRRWGASVSVTQGSVKAPRWPKASVSRRWSDSCDNALAETINGLCKAELIHRCAPRKTREAVEVATLEGVS